MKTPHWCTSVVHQYGSISTEVISIYISTFPNAQTSKRAQNREIGIFFFNELDRSLVSRTCIIQKFKML